MTAETDCLRIAEHGMHRSDFEAGAGVVLAATGAPRIVM